MFVINEIIKDILSINANNEDRITPAKIDPNVIPINNFPKFLKRLKIFESWLVTFTFNTFEYWKNNNVAIEPTKT